MKIHRFIRPEIEHLIQECNFTDMELELFNMRCKNIPLERCAERMNVSVSTINRRSKDIINKIMKVLEEG